MDRFKQIYEAACMNDVDQLNNILENYNETKDNLDDLLSKVCMELQLNCVYLSEDTKLFLERKLLSLRFFCKQSKIQLGSKDICDRIGFIKELIHYMHIYKDNDELFIVNLTFIAKQIFTLKRLIKSTYDRLPWEEIEFCVLSYIRASKEQDEIALFSKAILSKLNIMSYLQSFGNHLENLRQYVLIMKPQELLKLPNLKREEVVDGVVEKYPEFRLLYNDHERIRDIHSLNIMLNYVELVKSSELDEKYSILVLMRVLQVIGEHLKNTLESPKLSQTTISFLLAYFSESTRNLVINLRNTLSHIQSLSQRDVLLKSLESNFSTGIKNDIEKIGVQIRYIVSKYKLKVLRELGEKFVDTDDEEVMEEVASVMKNFGAKCFSGTNKCELKNNDMTRLIDLIGQYRRKISSYQSTYSEFLFEAIDQILKEQREGLPVDYVTALTSFHFFFDKFSMFIRNSHNKINHIRSMKYGMRQILKNLSLHIETSKLNIITDMIISINNLLSKQDYEVMRLFHQIIHIAKFELNGVAWTEKFGRKLRRKDYELDIANNEKFEGISEQQKHQKLEQLRDIFCDITYSEYKNNKRLQAVVEVLLLDAIPMLKHINIKLTFFLDDEYPTLLGVELRNHLAHNNIVIEVLLDSSKAIFLFVEKLLTEKTDTQNLELRDVRFSNLLHIKKTYSTIVNVLHRKQKMFAALKENSFEAFSQCILEGADIRSRDINMSTCLHFAMNKPDTIKLTKFLWKKGLSLKFKNLESQSPLHIAVTKKNLEVVEFLLKNFDCDVNDIDSSKKTAAHVAALSGRERILNSLINHGADMTRKDNMSFTPLQYAVLGGNNSVVEIFFKRNLFHKLNESPGGFTVLHIASDDGLTKMAQYLISKNMKIDARTDAGATPLQLAALNGNLDVVKALIRAGADVNCSNMNGNCSLHWACETGREEIVKILIEHGADVNVTDHEGSFAPMHYVAKDGYINIVKILLANSANVNLATKEGLTALFYAVNGRHLEIVKLLLKQKDIDVNFSDLFGTTPLHEAVSNECPEIVKFLIENGAKLDCKNSEGLTPLHLAAKYGDEVTVGLLITNNDSIHVKTMNEKKLPLHFAAESGNEKVIKKLIDEGSDINATTSNGANCLHIAIKNERNILDLLLQEGIKVDVKTEDHGFTPLHEAVLKNSLKMVESLLKAGSHINAQDNSGNTPIHLAIERDSSEIFIFLFRNGADITLQNEFKELPLSTAVKHNRIKLVKILMASGPIENKLLIKSIEAAIFEGRTNLVKLLLEHNPKLNLSKCYDGNEQSSFLNLAALLGRVDIVELLLNFGAAVDFNNKYCHSPLLSAAEKGCDEIVEILLKNGAQINVFDNEGITPLHIVSRQNNIKLVYLLLDHGADVNKVDHKNRLPVELAVANGNLETVKIFMKKNNSFLDRKGNDDFTLLHIAAQFGRAEMVKLLLDEGANMRALNNLGSMPIHIAAREGFTDIIDIFIDKGMTLDIGGCANNTLLHYAAATGMVEVVKYLIQHGCNINSVNSLGKYAIQIAHQKGYKEVVEYLLNNGAFYNVAYELGKSNTNDKINQILSSVKKLFSLIKDGEVVEIEKLIKEGVPLNSVDNKKGSAMHFAVYKGRVQVVEILLRNKVSTNLAHKNGWTPLHYAVAYSLDKMVFLLLSHGAKYDVEADNGKKPLDFAKKGSIRDLLQLITDCFKSIQKKDSSIVNRLKKIKDIEVMKAIMRTENKTGTTLITAAIINKFPQVEKLEEIFQENVKMQLRDVEDLCAQEKYQEAREKLTLIHEKRRDILGEDNPATLSIKSRIVAVLYKQQLYKQALVMSYDLCQKLETCLGIDHERTLRERSFLGLTQHRLGQNEESLKIFEEVHKIQKKKIPPDHEDSLNTIKHMALTLMSLGKLERALDIYKSALNIEEKKFGPLHLYTLVAKNNIALILSNQGQHNEALKLFQEVYEGRKLTLGRHHSDTLRSLHNKISVYKAQEKYDEASEAYKKLLKSQKEHLGLLHLDTLNTQCQMADLLIKQGKFFCAFKILKEVKDHKMALQGPNHIEIESIKFQMEVIVEQYRKLGLIGNLNSFLENLVSNMNNAAKKGDVDTIEKLIRSGVDVGGRDNDGRNSLHFAVDGNNLDVIKLLLEHGVDITEKTNKGNTALHTACNKGYKDIVEWLLNNVNVDKLNYLINAATPQGKMTALHIAAKGDFPEIVQLLLKKGALYNCVNKDGKRPVDLAKDESVKNILKITEDIFTAVEKRDFSVISKLEKMGSNDFLCITYAKNLQNNTLLNLLISYGKAELARYLTAMIIKIKNTVVNL